MKTDDLTWYRQRFEILKRLFEPGPDPDLIPFNSILVQRKRTALGEAETRLRSAALGYLLAMKEKIPAFGEEGQSLLNEIAAFVSAHLATMANRNWMSDSSGRSLEDWMGERKRQNPFAPATLKNDEDAPGDKGGEGGLPPFIPPDFSKF